MPDNFYLMDRAWTLHSVAEILHAAMPEDSSDALPLRSVVAHLGELAKELAEAIVSTEIGDARTTKPNEGS
ncbi:hypothetical protein AWB75_02630 [Caballeronia catudaia]|uniref:Uncharacterized protein n=1 Tax=Caballeronia catudaia TaxID=1777136 RepID=A0A158AUR3_9BURK|nr:hypothetical protein [Caballeronia catudaia]SAK61495.1 hypothetical protein AWB75_02630 [Caballeronia catudaia]